MKLLYVTDIPLSRKSGSGTVAKMHRHILASLFDEVVTYLIPTNLRGMPDLPDPSLSENDYVGSIPALSTCGLVVSSSTKIEKVATNLAGYPSYLNKRGRDAIFSALNNVDFDAMYVDNSLSGKLIREVRLKYPRIFSVAFFHDIEAVLMCEQESKASFLRRLTLPTYFRNEAMTVQYSNRTIVLNERDKELYRKVYGKAPGGIAPVCVPFLDSDTGESHHQGERLQILAVGTDYAPNVEGLRWFIADVIPELKFDFELKIVGSNMERYINEFETASPNVKVLGTVDSLLPFYQQADVVIAPISDGGGMKVKTAEAFSYGKRFIGLGEALVGYWEGLPESMRGVDVINAKGAEDFVVGLHHFYESEFQRFDRTVYEWAKQYYSYDAIRQVYANVFTPVLNGRV